jgi:sialic acid synthase SpsE
MWDSDQMPYDFEGGKNIYFHCVPEYPHTTERAISLMPKEFNESGFLGYSDHASGIDACKEAIRRGALYIEKHFTIDRSLQCKTEAAHSCSMDFDDLKALRLFWDRELNKCRDEQLETLHLRSLSGESKKQ